MTQKEWLRSLFFLSDKMKLKDYVTTKKIFALPIIKRISPALSRCKLGELDLITIDHPQIEASFASQGARLLLWKLADEKEVLWSGNSTSLKSGITIRNDMPLC